MITELEAVRHWFLPFLVKFVAAFAAGTIIGLERRRHRGSIGMRHCVLVCAGATTYMAIGHLILDHAPQPGDPTRIASQIITGIGFLGAGAILRDGAGVSGLSSAATIWFLGALGILIGCEYPLIGVLLSIVVVVLLTLVGRIETALGGG